MREKEKKRKIVIITKNITMRAQLNNSAISEKIWDVLPLEATCNRWGDELYFTIPVTAQLEKPVEIVQLGDLGYWSSGPALCIFFGPTPISASDAIKPASSVEIIGSLAGDPEAFKVVANGQNIRIERAL